MLSLCAGCRTFEPPRGAILDHLRPSNDRRWTPDFARLASVEWNGDEVTVRNIRNCQYVTEDDYVVEWYDRTFPLDDIRSVDFLVVPFRKTPVIAHTMLSFGLADGTWLCVSAEIRKEIGEIYSTIKGFANQFELVYVVGDERDLIRLRTRHRDAEVYVYPTTATAHQAQGLFRNIAARINRLQNQPEFYNTLTNNCTTQIQRHVNELSPDRVPFGWQVLLPGHSARYAWELGLLDNRVDFDQLTRLALVNDLAEAAYDAPDYSRRIRARHEEIARLARDNPRPQKTGTRTR